MKNTIARLGAGLGLAVALTSFAACTSDVLEPDKDDNDIIAQPPVAEDCLAVEEAAAQQPPTAPPPPALTCGDPVDECQTDEIGAAAGCGWYWVRPCIDTTVLVEVVTPDPEGEDVSQCGGTPTPLVGTLQEPGGEPSGPTYVNDEQLSPCKQKAMDEYLKCMEDSAAKRKAELAACDQEYNDCVASGAPEEGCSFTWGVCQGAAEADDIQRIAACSLDKANKWIACSTGVKISTVAKPVKKLGGWILKQFE